MTQYPRHVIFDEAQNYPELFGILRGVVDRDRSQKGRFIITGSSSPDLLSHASETLAGRVGLLELGTLKANEYYQRPLSPFYALFAEKLSREYLVSGTPPLSTAEMHVLWLKGGYPEPLLVEDPLFYAQWMDNYRETYLNRDVARLFPRLNQTACRQFLTILSKLSGTVINKRDVGRALEVTEGTVKTYLHLIWQRTPLKR